jgi:hypothetical protein
MGGSKKKKIVSEEIIETVDDVHKSSAPEPAKKIARISYDASAKSHTQVFMLFLSHLFNIALDLSNRDWIKLCNEEIYTLYSSSHIIRVIKSRRMGKVGYVEEMRNACQMNITLFCIV